MPNYIHDGSGGWICTSDLRVMSLLSYYFSTPLKGCWWPVGYLVSVSNVLRLSHPPFTFLSTNTAEDCSDGLGLLLSPSTAQYPFGLAHRNLHACWLLTTRYILDRHRRWYKASAFTNTAGDWQVPYPDGGAAPTRVRSRQSPCVLTHNAIMQLLRGFFSAVAPSSIQPSIPSCRSPHHLQRSSRMHQPCQVRPIHAF